MIPDRLCGYKDSPFYQDPMPDVRVTVNGVEFTGRVVEYCISSGWAKVLYADANGQPMKAIKSGRSRPSCKMKHGTVVVWRSCDPVPAGAIIPAKEEAAA